MDSVAQVRKQSLTDTKILARAVTDSFRKLSPRTMIKNPVMFVVEVGALLSPRCSLCGMSCTPRGREVGFGTTRSHCWLWFHRAICEISAEAMAEGRERPRAG